MRALIFALALAACSQPGGDDAASTAAPAAPPAPTSPAASAPTSTATASAEAGLSSMPSWEQARAAGVDFRAVGQEPGWLLDIYREDRMVLVWDYGSNRIELAHGEPTYPQEGQTRYAAQAGGHTLVVTTRRFPCQDAMSGAPYPASVEVVIDGRTLNGCGKSV